MTPRLETSNAWLSGLHPPVQPPEPALWPPAPGWWWLAALLLGGIGLWGVHRWRRWRRNGYRRAALAELSTLRAELNEPATRFSALRALPQLLRRVALAASAAGQGGTADIAPPVLATGSVWWAWLDERWPPGGFGQGFGAQLQRLAYAPEPQLALLGEPELTALCARIEGWIRGHRRAELLPC